MTAVNPERRTSLGGEDIESVRSELAAIRGEMVAETARSQSLLDQVHPTYQESARNLLHYLALRRRDIRPLQRRLAALGLSSLGRAESHVLATVDAVLEVLNRLTGWSSDSSAPETRVIDFATGERLLADHTEALLGPATPGRGVRIMVTMPSEAADDYTLVHDLLERGMDCMRINCAHDDAAVWARMIEHLRRAEQAVGRSCRVVMDLAGPKLRTGPLEPGPEVVRFRPERDDYGRVTAPARIWLTPEESPRQPPSPADACLPVPEAWLARVRPGERVRFKDARDARRTLVIVDVTDGGCWAEATGTAYVATGTVLRHDRAVAKGDERDAPVGRRPAAGDRSHPPARGFARPDPGSQAG